MSPYESLANAIIIQAAQDYLMQIRNLRKLPSNEPPRKFKNSQKSINSSGSVKHRKRKSMYDDWEGKCISCKSEIADIERFFLSDWYQILSNSDGNLILQMLKREAEKI